MDALTQLLKENDPVVQAPTGRWYITMGRPGFNSPANNQIGYHSADRARAAIAYYTKRGQIHRARLEAAKEAGK